MTEPERPLREWEEPAAVADQLHALTEDALKDAGSVASKRILGQIFERELDELATPEGSSYFSEQRASSREEEEKRREEKHLMAAVGKTVNEQLRGQGIFVARILLDGETAGGGGYFVACRDREGRQFEARFGLELAQRLSASGGTTNLVERMGHAVAREILAKRDEYFRRMGTGRAAELSPRANVEGVGPLGEEPLAGSRPAAGTKEGEPHGTDAA